MRCHCVLCVLWVMCVVACVVCIVVMYIGEFVVWGEGRNKGGGRERKRDRER